MLCGHTSCGGAGAALGDSRVGGVLDTWLTPLKRLRREHKEELERITDQGARAARLAEFNVIAGVETLMSNVVVEDAVNERGLLVHGVIFDIASGKLRDLGVGNAKKDLAEEKLVRGNHGMLVFGEGSGSMMASR